MGRLAPVLQPLFIQSHMLLLTWALGSQNKTWCAKILRPSQSLNTIETDELCSPFQLDSPSL